ncbi:MAG: class I SAM-dependent methyltransferase [Candidatus Riflebacteria bacterium]|nr:class I SAM-dependent methyltransferase [Candidatus Riflebacteria bacterium]
MEIGLERQGRLVAYDLVPGTHCAVRRDSQGRLGLYLGSHGRTDVPDLGPFVPTPKEVVERALKLAGVSAADVVYDLGCGDGRIVIEAARRYGARGVGVDLDPRLVRESQEAARAAAVERLVAFRAGDATQCDVTAATVVFMYLVPEANALLRPRLEAQLRPGSRVVSHDYPVPGWTAARAEIFEPGTGKKHYIFLYVMKK